MTVLAHSLDRSLVIHAPREVVFRYFTDSARWAAWWGAGSSIDPKRGGQLLIRYPDGTEAVGEVLEVTAPERIEFTYGYATGEMIPPGGSRVLIRLDTHAEGTSLRLTHHFADEAARNHHVQGWRYQLSLFSNIVANEVHGAAGSKVDAWLAAWTIAEDGARTAALEKIVNDDVRFRDRFSAVDGVVELVPHIGAALRFMPGIRLERSGDVRHCQGVVLADWKAIDGGGQTRGTGTSVFTFAANGKLSAVVGFWN